MIGPAGVMVCALVAPVVDEGAGVCGPAASEVMVINPAIKLIVRVSLALIEDCSTPLAHASFSRFSFAARDLKRCLSAGKGLAIGSAPRHRIFEANDNFAGFRVDEVRAG